MACILPLRSAGASAASFMTAWMARHFLLPICRIVLVVDILQQLVRRATINYGGIADGGAGFPGEADGVLESALSCSKPEPSTLTPTLVLDLVFSVMCCCSRSRAACELFKLASYAALYLVPSAMRFSELRSTCRHSGPVLPFGGMVPAAANSSTVELFFKSGLDCLHGRPVEVKVTFFEGEATLLNVDL